MTDPTLSDDDELLQQSGYTIRFADDEVTFANTRTFVPLLMTFIGVVTSIGFTILALLLVFDPEENSSGAIGSGVLAIIATTVTVFAWSRFQEQSKAGFQDSITHRLKRDGLFDERGNLLANVDNLSITVESDPLQHVGTRTYDVQFAWGISVATVFKASSKAGAKQVVERICSYADIDPKVAE